MLLDYAQLPVPIIVSKKPLKADGYCYCCCGISLAPGVGLIGDGAPLALKKEVSLGFRFET